MGEAVKLLFRVFLLSERRKTGKSGLPFDESGGKAVISSFPPLRAEENWKIRFTADESGGKAVISSFPPLGAEEDWKIDFTADGSGGNAAVSSFPPLRAAVMLRECPNIVARPFHFQLT